MSNFDVRTDSGKITRITVASEDSSGFAYITNLQEARHADKRRVLVACNGRNERTVIDSVEHARNLIKGLEKAIELGWLV